MASQEFAAAALRGEEHNHRHSRSVDSWRRLSVVLLLTAGYMLLELVGGWWTGSLALLADAGHMFTDTAALILALTAVWRPCKRRCAGSNCAVDHLRCLSAMVGAAIR